MCSLLHQSRKNPNYFKDEIESGTKLAKIEEIQKKSKTSLKNKEKFDQRLTIEMRHKELNEKRGKQ